MTSSEQEKHLLIQIQQAQSKTVFVQNVSAKYEQDQVKDEEAAPILIYTVFSKFLYSTDQRWRHRCHSDVIMDLLYWFWEIFSQRTVMPSLLVVGQQIKEKQRGYNVPPAYIATNTPAWKMVHLMWNNVQYILACCKIINPISTGPFYLVLAPTGGEVFFTLPPPCKIWFR